MSSPTFTLAAGRSATLTYRTWWEIESVDPSTKDLMTVDYSSDGGTSWQQLQELNPATDPPSGSGRVALANVGIAQVPAWAQSTATISSVPSASRTIKLRFVFDAGDELYQGFRGWSIDSVQVSDSLGNVLLSQGFESTPTGWAFGGMWNRQVNPQAVAVSSLISPLVDAPTSGGSLLAAYAGTGVAWFGEASSGTFCGAPYETSPPSPAPDPTPEPTPEPTPDPPAVLVPGAPLRASASAGNGQATVSWEAPGSDGGAAISSYVVEASRGGGSCRTDGARSCVVSGLENGTPYTFTVKAANSAGTGPASEPSNQVTPSAPPAPRFGSVGALKAASGTVKIRPAGSKDFIVIGEGASVEIKEGSEVDATNGKAQLAFQEAPNSGNRLADLSKGQFLFDQRKPRKSDPIQAENVTVLAPSAPLTSPKETRELQVAEAAASPCTAPWRIRKISGIASCGRYVGKGKRRTWKERSKVVVPGKNGSGSPRGTEFSITDSLRATTFKVLEGSVTARGGKPPKTVTIKAGRSYTFKAANKKR